MMFITGQSERNDAAPQDEFKSRNRLSSTGSVILNQAMSDAGPKKGWSRTYRMLPLSLTSDGRHIDCHLQ